MKSTYGSYDQSGEDPENVSFEHDTLMTDVDMGSLSQKQSSSHYLSIVTAHRMLLLVLGILATLMVVDFSGTVTIIPKEAQFDAQRASASTDISLIMDGPTLVADLLDKDG